MKQEKTLEWIEPEQHQVVRLYQMLDDADCTVLSVNRREPQLEEIFLSLTRRPNPNGTRA